MACIPTWRYNLLTAQKTRLEAQLTLIETTLTTGIPNSEIKGYKFEDGGGKQEVSRTDILKLNELEDSLTSKYNRVCRILNGSGLLNQRTARRFN